MVQSSTSASQPVRYGSEDNVVDCVCGDNEWPPSKRKLETTIQCDSCKCWQHMHCVRIKATGKELEALEFRCDRCRAASQQREVTDQDEPMLNSEPQAPQPVLPTAPGAPSLDAGKENSPQIRMPSRSQSDGLQTSEAKKSKPTASDRKENIEKTAAGAVLTKSAADNKSTPQPVQQSSSQSFQSLVDANDPGTASLVKAAGLQNDVAIKKGSEAAELIAKAQSTATHLGHQPWTEAEAQARLDKQATRAIRVEQLNVQYSVLARESYRSKAQRPLARPENFDIDSFTRYQSIDREDLHLVDTDGKLIAFRTQVDINMIQRLEASAAILPKIPKYAKKKTKAERDLEQAALSSQTPTGSSLVAQPTVTKKAEHSRGEHDKRNIMCWLPPSPATPRLEPMLSGDYTGQGPNRPRKARHDAFLATNAQLLLDLADRFWMVDLAGATKLAHLDVNALPAGVRPLAPSLYHGEIFNEHMKVGMEGKVHRDFNDDPECMTALVPYGDFAGGDLVLWDAKVRVELRRGEVLYFYGSILDHSSTVVTRGERNSMVMVAHKSLLVGRYLPPLREDAETAEAEMEMLDASDTLTPRTQAESATASLSEETNKEATRKRKNKASRDCKQRKKARLEAEKAQAVELGAYPAQEKRKEEEDTAAEAY